MTDMIFFTNGEENFRIPFPTPGTKCPETKLEVKKMTIRAEQIVNATLELTLRPQSGDRAKVIAAALRELNKHFDDWGGDEPSCCVFRDINDIADEVEAL